MTKTELLALGWIQGFPDSSTDWDFFDIAFYAASAWHRKKDSTDEKTVDTGIPCLV